MHNHKKLFYIFSGIYVFFSLTFFALNSFDFIKGVPRHAPNPECANVTSVTLDNNDFLFQCADTADLRWGRHFTWVSWQFFSNNRGYDNARYMPADIVLLSFVNAGIYLVAGKNHTKK